MPVRERKENRLFYFTVEGDTEKWYLEWLQDAINHDERAQYTVTLRCENPNNIRSYVMNLPVLHKTEITHIIDCESQEEKHTRRFKNILDRMKDAEKKKPKVKYRLGYSNFTFELWMILHKADCYGKMNSRDEYITHLNSAYGTNYESLRKYKHHQEFTRLLKMLTIDDVREAVRRSKAITKMNQEQYEPQQYRNYSYYRENPALSIGEAIDKILKTCYPQPKSKIKAR